jgi:hypothetical protein
MGHTAAEVARARQWEEERDGARRREATARRVAGRSRGEVLGTFNNLNIQKQTT